MLKVLLLDHCSFSFLVERLFHFLTLPFRVGELLGKVLLFALQLDIAPPLYSSAALSPEEQSARFGATDGVDQGGGGE